MQSTKVLETVHIILGPFLIFTRTSHLRYQGSPFLAKVTELPMQPDMVVLLSGGGEILSGEGLLFFPKQRNNVGLLDTSFQSQFFRQIPFK